MVLCIKLPHSNKNYRIFLLINLYRCNSRLSKSPYQLGKSIKRFSKYESVSDMNTATEILQGFTPLIKVCTYITTEKFQGITPLISLCPLGRNNYLIVPISQLYFSFFLFIYFWGFPLDGGGLISPSHYFPHIFRKA